MAIDPTSGAQPYNPYQPPSANVELGDGFEPSRANGPFRPWRTMWLHPRQTIRQIVDRDPSYCVLLLAALSGVEESFDTLSGGGLSSAPSLVAVLSLACLAGPFLGVLGVWLMAAVLAWTGRWLRGFGDVAHLRAALVWGSLPGVVVALPAWILATAILGRELFSVGTPAIDASQALRAVLFCTGTLVSFTGGWSIVLTIGAVAEVQQFRSAWRALGNVLLAGAVVLLPIFVAAYLVGRMIQAG